MCLAVEDPNLEVKKQGLLLVNTAVHHNPRTLQAHLASYVNPLLIETLKVKMERTVDLGPFKHKVSEIPLHGLWVKLGRVGYGRLG